MNPILEKIKKLLRMQRGGTQAEVETALAMAAELARKHGIDLAAVNPGEDHLDRVLGHADAILSTRLQWECKYAALVAENFFNVSLVCRTAGLANSRGWSYKWNYAITFIGTAADTEIAVYVYHFLVGHFRRSWNRSSGRLRNRQSFMWGMYLGLCHKLKESRKTAPQPADPNALTLVSRELERRHAYLEKHFGPTTTSSGEPDAVANIAALAGYVEGRKTDITPGLTHQPHHPQFAISN